MGLADKLKNALFEPEAPTPVTVTVPKGVTPITNISAPVGVAANDKSEQFTQIMLQNLHTNATAAYFKFVELANEMRSIIPDNSALFKAVMISLSKSDKLTAADIAKSSAAVLAALSGEKDKALVDITKSSNQVIDSQKQNLNTTNSSIEALEKQIAELGLKVQELRNERSSLVQGIQEAEQHFEVLKASLENAYTKLSSEINSQQTNINNFAK